MRESPFLVSGKKGLTGDYLWRSSTKVGAGKFRPLRPLPPA